MNDRSGKAVHFGCGFFAGIILLFIAGIQIVTDLDALFWVGIFLGAIIFGLLAARFGDDFWRGLFGGFR